MPRRQLNVRKSPQDEAVLGSIKRALALGDTSAVRLSIREFARRRGYWCSDMEDLLEILGEGVSLLRNSEAKGVGRVLARADRILQLDRSIAAERNSLWLE